MRLKDISIRFDYYLFFAMVLLIAIGCLMIYSAVYGSPSKTPLYARQGFYALLGIVVIIFVMGMNYRLFHQYGKWIYLFSLLLLALTLFFGKSVRGARSWFPIGNLVFQPAEFAKLGLIIALAQYFTNYTEAVKRFSGLIVPFLLTLAPVALIILQPDPGSALVYLAIFLAMLYLAGARRIYLVSFISAGILALGIPLLLALDSQNKTFFSRVFTNPSSTLAVIIVVIAIIGLVCHILSRLKFRVRVNHFLFASLVVSGGIMLSYPLKLFLKEYQKMRLVCFIKPSIDPLGAGYHIIQSQISIGSGGFLGKGLLTGTQGKLGFLPAQHTDFIFSLLSEEAGFVGAGLLILLFSILLLRAIRIASLARNRFGSLLAGGIVAMFLFQIIVNLGMTMGIMPVTGLPLPFVSCGGSSLITSMVGAGILLSIYSRRFTYR
ncbi:MAG: rod shape-determining protein RodA [Elusimicrobiota bacterium]|nr:rod shape-determining protein RodA [Elusimicrobiota bacterium]MDH5662523.1 rod shape-determining protein RodA [Elusimicrobiota bacterium]